MLRRGLWFGLLSLVVGGCATPGSETGASAPAQDQETLADILGTPLDAEEYGTPRRCISSFRYRDFEPLGDRMIVFEGPGDTLWLNELRGRCPGLSRSTALAFELRGNQICELDRFKASDWFQRFRRAPWDWLDGIPCTLGKFQPVSAEQVEAVRAAVDAR